MLGQLLRKSYDFQRFLCSERKIFKNAEWWIDKLSTALIAEAMEIKEEINWKHWKNRKEIDHGKLRAEICDAMNFVLALANKAGMNEKDLFDGCINAIDEGYKRQMGKSEKEGYEVEI